MTATKEVLFTSSSANFAVRVKTEWNVSPGNGRSIPKSKVVIFREGEHKTSDLEEIEAIRRSPVFGQRVFENDPQDDAFVDLVQEVRERQEAKLKATGRKVTPVERMAAAKVVKETAKKGLPTGGMSALAAQFKPGRKTK